MYIWNKTTGDGQYNNDIRKIWKKILNSFKI